MKLHKSYLVLVINLVGLSSAGSIYSFDEEAVEVHNYSTSNAQSLTVEERVNLEKTTFRWLPYHKIVYTVLSDGTFFEDVCPEEKSSIDDFWTFLNREQRLQGWITVHFIIAIYFFIFLAIVCDKYFIPAVERICEDLNISQDVAAGTFMATATTMPEFFTNTISIFLADSEMGLGATIGSMLFGTLGVAACASLFTKKPIQIDWWPITRDSILFSLNICVLIWIAWDGQVMWWETIILLILFVVYWLIMFQNPRFMKTVKNIVEDKLMWCQRIKNYDIANQEPYPNGKPTGTLSAPEINSVDGQIRKNGGSIGGTLDNNRDSYRAYNNNGFDGYTPDSDKIMSRGGRDRRQSTDLSIIYNQLVKEEEEEMKLWEIPKGASGFRIFRFFFTWPVHLILRYTIPNTTKHKKWYPLTFFMCIIWIGVISYIVFWMVVIVGDTFGIPEGVMGFTLLAFGGCMPEAISSVIIVRKGSGQMGVSNSLGANSFSILFSLGLPWFIRTMADGAGFSNAYIAINESLQFIMVGLLLSVITLNIVLAAAGYKLRKTGGGILAGFYLIFATVAVLAELDIIFETPC